MRNIIDDFRVLALSESSNHNLSISFLVFLVLLVTGIYALSRLCLLHLLSKLLLDLISCGFYLTDLILAI